MPNYLTGRSTYKTDKYGSLHIDEKEVKKDNRRPMIYIGGQMEHLGHVLERTGWTGDGNAVAFDGNYSFDYSVISSDKSCNDGEHFAQSLISCLREAKLGDVDLITNSYGGVVGGIAAKLDGGRIHAVYANHPPITGTPYADPKNFELARKLLMKEKFILGCMKLMVNARYGFQQDNLHGVLEKVDLNKLMVIGSAIDPELEKGFILTLYNMLKDATGYENDGVVVFDSALFYEKGINYYVIDEPQSHFAASSPDSFKRIREKINQGEIRI